ncbi:MAG: M42 family metallopeptidase [Deltaproteobacteria bacterium]|nr:M42 family metallopeptidase [Deltaproteobacteria bacterium]
MQKESKDFLFKLLKTPSPTGFEQKIQRVVRARMEQYADFIETDYHGNVIVAKNPDAEIRVMLAGHCDQIGMMVTHITSDGFIYFGALGGIDTGVLEGAHVTIHAKKSSIDGVIGRKPIHLQKPEERGKSVSDINQLWIDIGAKDKKEASKQIEIGDSITFKLGVTELANDLVCSPGLDDKAGLFVAMEAFRLCAKSKLKVGLFSVSTVQEEVGLRGAKTSAYEIDPDVGIAIDVTHAGDNPGKGSTKAAPCNLNKGPTIARGPSVNPVVEAKLIQAAKKHKIPFQFQPSPRLLGNDSTAIQVARSGVASAAIGIPNRYMHTQVEVCSLKDLENAAKLLAEFIKGLGARSDFTPK